jgi:hypothetical protein
MLASSNPTRVARAGRSTVLHSPAEPCPAGSATRSRDARTVPGRGLSAQHRGSRDLTDLGCAYVVHNPRLPGDEGGDALNERTYHELTELGDDEIPSLVDADRNEAFSENEAIVDFLEEQYG